MLRLAPPAEAQLCAMLDACAARIAARAAGRAAAEGAQGAQGAQGAEGAAGAEGAEAESVAPYPKGFLEGSIEAVGEGESFLAPKRSLPKKLLGPKFKALQSVEISAGGDRPGYDAA